MSVLLNALPAPVEGVTDQGDDVEGVHDCDRGGIWSAAAVLNPAKPSITTNAIPSLNAGVWASSQDTNTALDRH